MSTTTESHGGVSVTLRAALSAGALAGAATGLADGLVAGARAGPRGLLDWLGCLAGASFVYGLVWTAVALALALAAHRWLRWSAHDDRRSRLLAGTLGVALFLELYWWTRPWLFPGLPASDPKRLAAAALLFAIALVLAIVLARATRALPARAWRVAAIAIAVAWLGGGAYLLVARSNTTELGQINERNRNLPNVLLVINDALRADVLGCYGNTRVKTPRIDALAANGVLFEHALVQAPFTGTSFGSYFTGKYPRRHGFVSMVSDQRMAPNITLASHLKSAQIAGGGHLEPDDYDCVTFMTGALTQAMGLMQGFDSYYEAFEGHELVDRDDPWSVFRSELVLFIVKSKLKQRLEDAPAAAEAVRWFGENGHKRFFAMLHTFSTHTPYDPPAEFRALYCDPHYAGPVSAFRSDHRKAIEEGVATPTPADIEQIRNLYYGGASHDDRQLERVLAELERQGVLANTLVIVTADHGEELGDHGLWEHNHMFQTNLHVPLVMALPGKLPANTRVGALVESVDVVPTVCDLLGLVPPSEKRDDARGRSYGSIDGVSLLPLVRGQAGALKEFSFAENGLEMSVQDRDWKLIVPAVPIEGRELAAIAATPVVKPRLFHLGLDADEHTNVFDSQPAQAQRLYERLQAWDATLPIPVSDVVQSARDREQLDRRLRELGYGDGVGQDVGPPKKKKP